MRKWILVFALVLAVSAVADAPTDVERNLKADPARGMKDAVILLKEGTIDDTFTSRLSKQSFRYRFKVFTRKGVEDWGTVKLTFDPQDENIGDIKATVWNPDGTVHKLTEEDIHRKKVSREWGLKMTEVSFALPGLTEGSIAEYSYYLSYKNPQSTYYWYPQSEVPTLESRVTFIPWPMFRWGYTGGNVHAKPELTQEKVRGRNTVKVVLRDIPARPREKFSAPYNSLREFVCFYYSDVDRQYNNYWLDRGAEYYKTYLRKKTKPNRAGRKLLARELAGLDTDQDHAIDRIYNYVISHYFPIDTLSRQESEKIDEKYIKKLVRAGDDMKDLLKLSYLLDFQIDIITASLIRTALPDARVEFVFYLPWNRRLFNKNLRRLSQLSSEMLLVTWHGKKWWLAPAQRLLKAGMVEYAARGVPLLVVGEEGARFEQLKPLASDQTATEIVSDVTLEDEVIRVKRTTTLNPYKSFSLRKQLFYFNDDEIRDVLKEGVKKLFGDDAELVSYSLVNFKDIDKPLIIQETFTFPYELESLGDRMFLKMVGLSHYTSNPFNGDKRYGDILFPYPYQERQTVTYHFPDDLVVDSAPRNEHVDTISLTYHLDFEKVDDHTLRVTSFEEMKRSVYSKTAFQMFKNLFNRMISVSNPKVALKEL